MITLNDQIINSLSIVHSQLNVNYGEYLLRKDVNEDEYKNHIKQELMKSLVQEMMKLNLIEFTAQEDLNRLGKIYRARLVAIPSEVIQRLRKERKIP